MTKKILTSSLPTSKFDIDSDIQIAFYATEPDRLYFIYKSFCDLNNETNIFMKPEAKAKFIESLKPYISCTLFDETMNPAYCPYLNETIEQFTCCPTCPYHNKVMQIFIQKAIEYTKEDTKPYILMIIILCQTFHTCASIVEIIRAAYDDELCYHEP